jgi:putative ABC transport system permease protein
MVWNSLLLALREIRRNVMRSLLTMLGIVIGVAAVIAMVTIGGGATAQVSADIEKLGSNLLVIRIGQHRGPGGSSASASPFDAKDVQAISRQIPNIAAIAPSASSSGTIIFGNQNWSTTVTGTDNGFFRVRDWSLESGRQFTENELRSGKAVCILGATVRKKFFGTQDPTGSKMRIEKIPCQVIGVLASKGQSGFGTDQDDLALIPLRTFQRRIAGNQDIGIIQVSVEKGASPEKAAGDIAGLLRERRRISASKDDDFHIADMKEIAETLTGTTRVLTALLGAVAAVSLVVGGIGIMNIMLVSVTERTREIGIRLAVGALEREVLLQFLIEAVVLSSIGGVIGIVLALSASAFLVRILQVPFILNTGIIALSFVFSAAVGVVFGYLPARQAARLDPIEALRHE